MRIAFYAPLKAPTHPVPSGDRRMARLLMAALAAAGHEVDLACTFRSWDDAGVPGRAERLGALGRRLAGRLAARRRAAPPDLWFTYHLYHKAPDWLGPAVSAALGIPYVVAEASHAPKRAAGPFAAGHAAAEAAIRRADAVIALTGHDVPALRPLLAEPERLVRMAPFIETAPFAAAARARAAHRADLARRFALPPDVPWLLAVGMTRAGDKQASYAVLAAALALLTERPWALLTVGDGPARAAVEAGFARLPAGRVRFAGALEADGVAAACAAADLMVWPAVNEAYGMALLEGQAAGLPVVAGRTGGVPDVVRDGVTGVLPPVGDAAAFAAAVAALLDDPARRAAMGAAAKAAAAAEHGMAGAVRTLDSVLARVAARRRNP